MSKSLIGGGFPGIKECVNQKNELTKESITKREFSVGKKAISISNILKTKGMNIYIKPEKLNIKQSLNYNSIENIIHNSSVSNIKINKINRPIKK
jgi:hypothetical protein